jgi:hypothetical protein
MDSKTLEQAAWELLGKPHELHTPHERSIADAWARERSLMNEEEWSRHISRMKAEKEEKLTVPPTPTEEKEAPSQNDQQSDKTASDADKDADSSGSQGEGEDSG